MRLVKIKNVKWLVLLTLVLMIFAVACSKPAGTPGGDQQKPQAPRSLTWTAGSMGGGWYSQAGGFAELMVKKETGLNIKVIPGGGVANVPLVNKNEVEIGWGLPPLIAAAARGEDPYDQVYNNLRGVATDLGISYFHFIVGADTPFQTIKDVFEAPRGTNITVSVVGSSDEWVFRKVMAFYGESYDSLKSKGFRFFHAGYSDQATQFRDRNVDAYFTFMALPAAAVTEASLGRQMRFLEFPDELIANLKELNLGSGVIPAGTYPRAENGNVAIKTATMSNAIVVHKDLSEDIVYTLIKTICENLAETKAIHPAFAVFNPETAWQNIGAPLHPGAERYYREKGYIK